MLDFVVKLDSAESRSASIQTFIYADGAQLRLIYERQNEPLLPSGHTRVDILCQIMKWKRRLMPKDCLSSG